MSAMYVSSLFDYCRVGCMSRQVHSLIPRIYIFNRQGMYMDQNKV